MPWFSIQLHPKIRTEHLRKSFSKTSWSDSTISGTAKILTELWATFLTWKLITQSLNITSCDDETSRSWQSNLLRMPLRDTTRSNFKLSPSPLIRDSQEGWGRAFKMLSMTILIWPGFKALRGSKTVQGPGRRLPYLVFIRKTLPLKTIKGKRPRGTRIL